MANHRRNLQSLFLHLLLLLVTLTFPFSQADVGIAAQYNPPYLRKHHYCCKNVHFFDSITRLLDWVMHICIYYAATACFGSEESQFPTNDLFAAAGEGIWDNGASCGRQYLVRCISASNPTTCFPEQTIQIRIVDRAQNVSSGPDPTIVLSDAAYSAIADPSADTINIEFQQV
ncbi:EG45-like domain containing protein isoform X1 [Tripterygium wilfordii]|uniref:EG45-like domain containing protein isoform X1 n=1 Tax=Tripterygium wilfordii TaxID=458696 RepID=UPI0018F83098|nr:EG45-like domain containing protein isoform X1 [Tripterygium wilfordii]